MQKKNEKEKKTMETTSKNLTIVELFSKPLAKGGSTKQGA
jgi:hypothetical protein